MLVETPHQRSGSGFAWIRTMGLGLGGLLDPDPEHKKELELESEP